MDSKTIYQDGDYEVTATTWMQGVSISVQMRSKKYLQKGYCEAVLPLSSQDFAAQLAAKGMTDETHIWAGTVVRIAAKPAIEQALADAASERAAKALEFERNTLAAAVASDMRQVERLRARGQSVEAEAAHSRELDRCDAARQALAEFDAAHPEIAAAIYAERDAAAQRLVDNG